jgi:hypothetical protein
MPLLRHHVLLLGHDELSEVPLVGPAFRIRPSDGDATFDRDQHWFAYFDLHREGDGTVTAQVSTSFDGETWHKVASVSTRRASDVVDVVELDSVAPLVRVETSSSDAPVPLHSVTVRLASDAPFAVQPA